MPLLDLTKITLNRTFAGICCPACSGKLEVSEYKERSWFRLFSRQPKSRIRYRCLSCGKRFVLTQTAL